MARERGLPEDWLNDSVKSLMPEREQPVDGTSSFSARGIHVGVAAPDYLFAMKAMAARQEADGDDLRLLARELKLKNSAEALDLVERFYGAHRLTARTQLIVEAIMAEVEAERAVTWSARHGDHVDATVPTAFGVADSQEEAIAAAETAARDYDRDAASL